MVAFPMDSRLTAQMLTTILASIIFLDYFANFPHFAYSYQLLYDRFPLKIKGEVDGPLRWRYVFAGIIIPIAMIAFFTFCVASHSVALLKHAVNVMLLTAGWHYAKQGFGILVVSSVYQKIFYTPLERKLLLANSHLLWIFAWIMFNTGSSEKVYFGITFLTLGIPVLIEKLFFILVCLSTVGAGAVLWLKFSKGSQRAPLNGITAYVATAYLWVILRFGMGYDHPIHPVVLLIPFMHSVQYITIVLKMKNNEVKRNAISRVAFWIFTVFGLIIGTALFVLVPTYMDKSISYDPAIYGTTLFMFMFWIFINIHHYFIDNVIWRKEGGEAKEYLFAH
jgi:hypothetical protein